MKFATIGHLTTDDLKLPREFIKENLIVSPEINVNGTIGHIIGLQITAEQIMNNPRKDIQQKIVQAALFAQNELDVDIIQLGALTTSVTSGGTWLTEQKEYTGYVNHGDSYTAAVTCQATEEILKKFDREISEKKLAIIGAYGVIGEAVSKILVPKFKHTTLIGRREEKLKELSSKIKGSCNISTTIITDDADVIITATNHPKALIESKHLRKNAVVIDVSQPPNVSKQLCNQRKDIVRIDGGYVDFPIKYHIPIPSVPEGKLFACIVETIMQAMENEHENHVGSIDLDHLEKTKKWARKYGFMLKQFTNFGEPVK